MSWKITKSTSNPSPARPLFFYFFPSRVDTLTLDGSVTLQAGHSGWGELSLTKLQN